MDSSSVICSISCFGQARGVGNDGGRIPGERVVREGVHDVEGNDGHGVLFRCGRTPWVGPVHPGPVRPSGVGDPLAGRRVTKAMNPDDS